MRHAGRLIDLADPRLRRLHAYWSGLRGGRLAPGRSDLDPMAMRELLGQIAVVELQPGDGAARYHYRLMGTRLADQDGVDLTGKSLASDPSEGQRDQLCRHYDAVVQSQQPAYRELERQQRDRRYRYGCLAMPLSQTGTGVDGLLVARVYLSGSLASKLG